MVASDMKTMKVLVVDDDPTMFHFWSRFLKGIGLEKFDLLDDPLLAVSYLHKKKYRLLITDAHLKTLNGFELAKVGCKASPGMDVILSTSHVTDLTRFDLAGCRLHLLHKPFSNLEEIKRIIECMLTGDNVFADAAENSFSDNEDYPLVTEWKL